MALFSPYTTLTKKQQDLFASTAPQTQKTAASSANLTPAVQASIYKQPKTTAPATNGYSLASGNTTQYAQNPTNYQPTVQKPPAPDTKNYTNSYLDTLKRLAESSATNYSTNASDTAKLLQESYDRQNKNTQSLIPLYQQGLDTFRGNVNAGITDQEALAKQQEAQTKETYGEALRRSAQANRETQGQLQNIFAGLKTLDSSAFQQQAINQGNRFTAGQQSTLRQQANDVSGIYRSLGDYKRQASQAINEAEQNLQAKLIEINNTLDKNSVEYQTAVRAVYNEAFNNINAIEQGLAKAEFENTQKAPPNLSAEFMRTGIPQTQEDFIYKTENSGAFDSKVGVGQANQEKQALVDVIDKLAGGNIGAITGIVRTGWIPGTQGALTKNYYDQLKGMLSLENRAKLKGSGAISDFESKTLDRAASALGQNLSEDQFRSVLNDLRTNLGGGQTGQSQTVRVQSPTGQVGTIDASELQSALASGWRQV